MLNRLSPNQLQAPITVGDPTDSQEQATDAVCSSFWNAKGPFS